jgi:hypothetical protein
MYADMMGWSQQAEVIAGVFKSLPVGDQAGVAILAGNYGQAGAIDYFGPAMGLPHAISGHNNYWWWGTGRAPDDSTTIAVNIDRSYLQTIFAGVEAAGQVRTPGGVWTEERGAAIYLCRGQRRSWAAVWPSARHYG